MSEVGYVLKTTLILENVVFCIPWKFLQTYLTAESGYCWNRLLAGHWKLWTPYSFPLFVFASKPVRPVTSTWKFEPHSSRSLHNSSAQALVVSSARCSQVPQWDWPSRGGVAFCSQPSTTAWWFLFGCHFFIFPYLGLLSSSQVTKSYFSEGWPNHQPD